MIRTIPNTDRPVDSTTCAPASTAAATASTTAAEACSSASTRVPSMSSATSRGVNVTRRGPASYALAGRAAAPRELAPSRRPAGGSRGPRRSCASPQTQCAVERGDVPGALGEPHPDTESAGLEVGAVRRRGELAVPTLGRDPRLAVELAGRRQAEVAGGHVDDAERQLELAEELLLPGRAAARARRRTPRAVV